jgi:hypothetical protein
MESMSEQQDHLTLKWGTLKAWDLHSEKGKALLKRYFDLGTSAGAATADDTPEQKDLICQMIDECNAPTIFLAWDGIGVSKEEAKRYVLDYSKPKSA